MRAAVHCVVDVAIVVWIAHVWRIHWFMCCVVSSDFFFCVFVSCASWLGIEADAMEWGWLLWYGDGDGDVGDVADGTVKLPHLGLNFELRKATVQESKYVVLSVYA